MSDVLIGTYGWEHRQWHGGFYPEELPEDWRFCFFSNRLRAVLVPAVLTQAADAAAVQQWHDDSDDAFRFIWEVSATAAADIAPLLQTLAPLAARSAGILWRPPAAALVTPVMEPALMQLSAFAPVSIDLPPPAAATDNAVAAMLARYDAGVCWQVSREPLPLAGGRLSLALMEHGDPRALRRALETVATSTRADAAAGLFFTDPARSASLAEQARVLAELMGV